MGCRLRKIIVPLQTNTEESEGFYKFEFTDARNCEYLRYLNRCIVERACRLQKSNWGQRFCEFLQTTQ